MRTRRYTIMTCGTLSVAASLASVPISGQEPDLALPNGALAVETNLDGVVGEDTPVHLTFEGALDPSARAAVLIGDTDVTALFERTAQGLVYESGGLPLFARGEQELSVHVVEEDGTWVEVHRQSVQVGDGLGFMAHEVDPSVTVEYSQRLADGMEPDDGQERDLRGELRGALQWRTRHVRGASEYATEAMVVGVEDRQNALRYGELLAEAPKYDLADYRLQGRNGPVQLELGHVTAGNQRHLVRGLSSRGAAVRIGEEGRVSAGVAALAGSSIVGWDNLVGLGNGDHRILTGSVAVDALSTPGALRLTLHGLTGSVLPQVGFNSGEIVDAEESSGFAASLAGAAVGQRVRFDVGVARSTFNNPEDPFLDQGLDVVPVVEETNYARYAEASLDLIRNLRLGETRSIRLTIGGRHENVDPLYRSLGAYAAADRRSEALDLQLDVAGVGVQASMGMARNNLDDIPSILTTKTRTAMASFRLPLGQIVGSDHPGLPSINGQVNRTHQFGDNLPVDGGFSPSHIPDQISITQSASIDWGLGTVAWGYRWTRSDQDNLQEGREEADFEVVTHGMTVSINPVPRVSTSLDVGLEKSRNRELLETDQTLRFGGNVNVQVFTRSSIAFQYSDTNTEDLGRIRRQGGSSLNLSWTSMVPTLGPLSGQYFLRYSRSSSRYVDTSFDTDDQRTQWMLDLGVNLTFFQP